MQQSLFSEEDFTDGIVWEYSVSLQPIDTNRRGVNINKALKLIGCINFDIYSLLGRKNILE